MDELVHHCVRELSFDGDLGCSVSRLRDFIGGFHLHNATTRPQTVDEAYCSFVWSVVVQQPAVRVGTVPPGDCTEVYLAPQSSAKRKARDRGEEHEESVAATTLNVVTDANSRPLEELKSDYGDTLRIAVDPETSFAAITGSHIRPSKLSPMVYTALQLITRGRENGISVTELGKKSKYDQKTCHYLVNQLLNLNLIVKIRRGGVGTHFCIHKYFFDRSPLWNQIREEEAQGNKISHEDAPNEQTGHEDEDPTQIVRSKLNFDPIDARHLSSLPLVKARVVKLLKNSQSYMHAQQNMLLKIGFSNPTKTDRRFFQTRLNDLIAQGVIEKILVPNAASKSKKKAWIQCIRLKTPDRNQADEAAPQLPNAVDVDDKVDIEDPYADDDESGMKWNLTPHKQMIDLLEGAGTRGLTQNELSDTLGHFDKRTIELLLARLEKHSPPAHLADLGVAELMETHGRERRHRYYTIAAYRALVAQENLHDSTSRYADVDFSFVGGFAPVDPALFYEDEETLVQHQDHCRGQAQEGNKGKVTNTKSSDKNAQPKNKEPKKPKTTMKDSTPKHKGAGSRSLKRKRDQEDEGNMIDDAAANVVPPQVPTKPTIGRPPRKKRVEDNLDAPQTATMENTMDISGPTIEKPALKKKRGRPPTKARAAATSGGDASVLHASGPGTTANDNAILAPSTEKISGRESKGTVDFSRRPTRHVQEAVDPGDLINDDLPSSELPVRTSGQWPTKNYKANVQQNFEPEQLFIDDREIGPSAAAESSEAVDIHLGKQTQGRVHVNSKQLNHMEESLLQGTLSATANIASLQAMQNNAMIESMIYSMDSPLTDLDSEPEVLSSPLADGTLFTEPSFTQAAPGVSESSAISVMPTLNLSHAHEVPMNDVAAASPSGSSILSVRRVDFPQFEEVQNRYDDTSIPIDPVLLMDDTGQRVSDRDQFKLHTNNVVTPSLTDPPASAMGVLPAKRHGSESAVNEHRTKRLKYSVGEHQQPKPRPKANVSLLRRENELFQLINELGGITLTSSKDFVDAHVDLIERLTKTGEPTSAPPGSRLDKRTIDATLNNLESRGQVKTLKTVVRLPTGSSRPARVTYLTSVSQDRINAFLSDVGRNSLNVQLSTVKKINEDLTFAIDPNIQRKALPLQLLQLDKPAEDDTERWARNFARADQLFAYDDVSLRNVLLAEKHTLAQLYGFKIGKMIRARELHLHMLRQFEERPSSPRIASLDQRIVHFSYFCTELPVSTYFSVISALAYDDRLSALLSSHEGKRTPVDDIEPSLHAVLQIGRSRHRLRFLDILEILRSLKLVTPLEPSDVDTAYITCTPTSEHPSSYKLASLEGWSNQTLLSAPVYWRFNTVAPIRLWALSEDSPPVHTELSILNTSDASAYWRDLQQASVNSTYANSLSCPEADGVTGAFDANAVVGRCIRRAISWNEQYVLTWFQNQYLKTFVNQSTAQTPLDDQDGGEARLSRICWIICAPREVVHEFYVKARTKRLHELNRAYNKSKPKSEEEKEREAAKSKALFAQKSLEAKLKREQEWDALLNRIYPEGFHESAAMRVRAVRIRFLQSRSSKDMQRWEDEIVQAVQAASLAAEKLLLTLSKDRPLGKKPAVPPDSCSVILNAPEHSVETLVARQGRPLPHRPTNTKSKGKQKDLGELQEKAREKKQPQRRNRFNWDRDYDELIRDASAIIRARCRGQRIDWTGYDQIFPAVNRNSVRQRLVTLKEAPGADIYLKRLEDSWYDLWIQHRGTDLLPDDRPGSPSNFDFIKHLEFLRKHIDKNALRMGFQETKEELPAIIPTTVAELFQDWDIVETKSTETPWDFMWSSIVEEGREKCMARQSFLADIEDLPSVADSSSDMINVAETALKMVLGTPDEVYDPEVASRLLHRVGEQAVSVATSKLLSRGVLSKLVRDLKKPKPGRTLKISDMNQNALGGPIPQDAFQDASALDEISSQQEGVWREWPLLASDGDCAVLVQLVSENKVECTIDTSQAQAARPVIDWNSKKADDDQIELGIHVRFHDLADPALQSPNPRHASVQPVNNQDEASDAEHGITFDGSAAACRRMSAGPIDCQACLVMALSAFVSQLSATEAELVNKLIPTLWQAGTTGLTEEQLMAEVKTSHAAAHSLLCRLAGTATPLVYWVGYSEIALVSPAHVHPWTLAISDNPITRVFPRRWLDISGLKIHEVWEAALRAVMGVIIFRPGISHAEICWRLRAVYNRQEVNDVLLFLQEQGFVEKRLHPSLRSTGTDIPVPNNAQQKMTMWFVSNSRHWYQI